MTPKLKGIWEKAIIECMREYQEEYELRICGDCDEYKVCPLIGDEDRGECEKIRKVRSEGNADKARIRNF